MKKLTPVNLLYLFVGVLFLFSQRAAGQTEIRIAATAKTSFDSEASMQAVKNIKKKHYLHIVTTDIRNIGYGNLCVAEETHRMGFTYTPMPVSEIERRSAFHYFIHNQVAKFKITLKNGPFWKHRLNKRIKECRQLTGDFNG